MQGDFRKPKSVDSLFKNRGDKSKGEETRKVYDEKTRFSHRIFNERGFEVTPKNLIPDFNINNTDAFKLGTAVIPSYILPTSESPPESIFDWQVIDNLITKGSDARAASPRSRFSSVQYLPQKLLHSKLREGSIIILKETETSWHMELEAMSVMAEEGEVYENVLRDNEEYKQVLKRHEGSKGLCDIAVQTYNYFLKSKSQQTLTVTTKENGLMVTTTMLQQAQEVKEKPKVVRTSSNTSQEADEQESVSNLEAVEFNSKAAMESLSSTPNLVESILLVFRALNINTYRKKVGTFKGYMEFEVEESTSNSEDEPPMAVESDVSIVIKPLIITLATFSTDYVIDYEATCLTWSPTDENIFAVGYVHKSKMKNIKGIVLCWSVKNLEFPERIFYSKTGVTALEFSKTAPMYLAVGMYTGIVALYDVRKFDSQPLDDNIESNNRTTGTIWAIKWMPGESSESKKAKEAFVTCSDDGYIMQYIVGNGLHSVLMMRLKRVPTPGRGNEENLLSRYARGFTMDFKPKDKELYLVGTDEGLAHLCSTTNAEQYLKSYIYHKTPIHSVRWSPFAPSIFIACGSDWTITVWNYEFTSPGIIIQSYAKRAVIGLDWSARSATMFACFTETTMEIWDIDYGLVEPIAFMTYPLIGDKFPYTCLSYNRKHDAIILGDDGGNVLLNCLFNLTQPKKGQVLIDTVMSNFAKTQEQVDTKP